jgi:hypothetical protein
MKALESFKLRWITWVWKHTPDCAEMARLSSRRLDAPLPLAMRLRMRLHFLICVWCHRYLKQLELLHEHAHGAHEHFPEFVRHGLPAAAKRRIVERLLMARAQQIEPAEGRFQG